MATFVASVSDNFELNPNASARDSMFEQFERTVVQSLLTSFGLDMFIKDRHGGDVDTIHNVRQIDDDKRMDYKNEAYYKTYLANPNYNQPDYHQNNAQYRAKREKYNQLQFEGRLLDDYTGKLFSPEDLTDVEHVISANEIHNDRGRVLSGLDGVQLANSDDNLCVTHASINRAKNSSSMDEYLERCGDRHTEAEKNRMRSQDKRARKAYEHKLFVIYYTSPQFLKDTSIAAGSLGMKMGLREAVGLALAEIWFSVSSGIRNMPDGFTVSDLFSEIKDNICKGVANAKAKYKEIFNRFKDGALAGIMSSLTTTLCNIFLTTAKNAIKILRQTWASITEAIKILFFNPDGYPLGDQIKAAVKVLALGASVVAGTFVSEMIATSPIAAAPVVGDMLVTFCGTLTSGVISIGLLYILDRSELVAKLVAFLNSIPTVGKVADFYRQQADRFEEYAASLMAIDLESFRRETAIFTEIAMNLNGLNLDSLNNRLLSIYKQYGFSLPYEGNFDNFMRDSSKRLTFN